MHWGNAGLLTGLFAQSSSPSSRASSPSRVREVRTGQHPLPPWTCSNRGTTAGKLVKDLSHLSVNFAHPKKNTISIEIHHGARKDVATLRTVRSIINNMIIGVTKGFKYKMRYVYAHFPINVNLEKNQELDIWEVEIRNFIGEKIVRRVKMLEGVDVEISKNQKDELVLFGNSLENVSQSAADIQQICKVRNKDIRKVRLVLLRAVASEADIC